MPGHEVNRKLGSDPSGSSGILTVVAVAHAAHRRLDTGFGQALGVFDRDVLGGFKRSSQQSLCWLIEAIGQAPLQAFSNQASFGAGS
jgi:hypothetical protein